MKNLSDDVLLSLEEEDIPKKELLKRLFDLRAIVDKSQGESEAHWQDSVSTIGAQFNQMLQQERKFMEQKQADIQSLLSENLAQVGKTIENALAKFSQKLDEHTGKVEQKFSALQNDTAKKLDDSEVKFGTDQRNAFASVKKELELAVNNAMGQFVGKLNEHRRDIDTRFNGLESLMEKRAEKEVEKYFLDLTKTVNEGKDFIGSFKAQMADQITKFQSDSNLRVSSLNGKLEDVLGKLRSILKDL